MSKESQENTSESEFASAVDNKKGSGGAAKNKAPSELTQAEKNEQMLRSAKTIKNELSEGEFPDREKRHFDESINIYSQEIKRIGKIQESIVGIACFSVLVLVFYLGYSIYSFNAHTEQMAPVLKAVVDDAAVEGDRKKANIILASNVNFDKKSIAAANKSASAPAHLDEREIDSKAKYEVISKGLTALTTASFGVVSILVITISVIIFSLFKAAAALSPAKFMDDRKQDIKEVKEEIGITLPSIEYVKQLTQMLDDLAGKGIFKSIGDFFRKLVGGSNSEK